MLNWREYPFLLITLFYVLGLWAAAEAGQVYRSNILFAFLLLSTTLVCWSALAPFYYRLRSVFSVWLWLSILLLGGWRYRSVEEAKKTVMDSLEWSSRQSLPVLVLSEEVKAYPGKWRVTGRLLQVGDTVPPEPVRLLLYIEQPPDTVLEVGTRLLCITRLRRIPDNPNPELFNYAAFLRQKGVYYQGYVSAGNARLLYRRTGEITWDSYVVRLRSWCMKRLKQVLPESDRLAVGAALIIGNREQLDAGVRNVFSRTGAMHILAVSGLHVGLIAWLFGWLIGKIPGLKNAFGAGLQLAGVWGYVLLCGAGASVVRAGLMFSWIALGKQLNRPVSIWNSWSGSALFLLLYDPGWLFDVGFQLSYLAVAGIVLFQPPITALWRSSSRLGRYFWELSAVGLAAQLVTSPLTIYRFHQFSFAFLPSGWVAVPLGAAIQVLGMGVLVLGEVPFIGGALGYLLRQTIGLLLEALRVIDRVPGQCAEGIGIDGWMVAWLFLLLVNLALFKLRARGSWREWLLAACLLAGAVGRVSAVVARTRNQQVICYGIRGATALECWNGVDVYTWEKGDAIAITSATEGVRMKYRPNHIYHRVQEAPDWVRLEGARLWFQGLRIYIWDGSIKNGQLPDANADYWLLRGNPFIPDREMAGRRPKQGIILDGSNSTYRIAYYTHWAKERGISVWNTMEKGAWIQTRTP